MRCGGGVIGSGTKIGSVGTTGESGEGGRDRAGGSSAAGSSDDDVSDGTTAPIEPDSIGGCGSDGLADDGDSGNGKSSSVIRDDVASCSMPRN